MLLVEVERHEGEEPGEVLNRRIAWPSSLAIAVCMVFDLPSAMESATLIFLKAIVTGTAVTVI